MTVVLVTFNVGNLNPLNTRIQPSTIPVNITMIEPTARTPAPATLIQKVSNTMVIKEKKKLQIC